MINKSNIKLNLMIMLLGIIFIIGLSVNVDAKTSKSVSNTYYANKKIKSQVIVRKSNKKVVEKDFINFDTKGKRTTATYYYYNNKQQLLTKNNYKMINNKNTLLNKTYYYNVHARKKVPTQKPYLVEYFNSKGQKYKVTYTSKAAQQNAIISMAKKQVGKSYRAGSAGPRGFDCSGLTSYVYKQALNKNIGRSTYNQKNKGKRIKTISTKSLQPGDILLWGSQAAPYHAGIYIGNGKYVHASTPRTGVEINSLKTFKPSFAQRII